MHSKHRPTPKDTVFVSQQVSDTWFQFTLLGSMLMLSSQMIQ